MTVNEGGPEGHTPPLTEGPSLPNTESGARGHDAGVVATRALVPSQQWTTISKLGDEFKGATI